MSIASGALLFLMGIMAGIINSAVGSGSLLTLPVLMALGVPPGVAVRTNTIGLMFASFGSAWGFRHETKKEMPFIKPLIVATIIGAASGSLLLLFTPSSALDFVIPILIIVALILVIFQQQIVTLLSRWSRGSDSREVTPGVADNVEGPVGEAYRKPGLIGAMGLASVYGGFFTAAQGVIYMAIMGVGTGRSFKDVNPVKNFLSMLVNSVAALVYLIAFLFFGAEILWIGVAILAVGGLIGGLVGARIAKNVSNRLLKGLIVVVAVYALIRQFV